MSVTTRPASPVNPSHYRQEGKQECIDFIREDFLTRYGANLGLIAFMGFCEGNAIKYRWRAGLKGDAAEDEAKAQWYEAMSLYAQNGGPDPRVGP